MADLRGFDANEVEPMAEFTPLPSGKYLVVVTDSEFKPNKSGTGSYLQLTFEVIEGEHKGRKLWVRLNLNHPNQTAVKIARPELSAVCRATGIMQPRDSVELHDIPLCITVKMKRRKDTDDLENVIAKYETKDALRGVPQQAEQSTTPWRR